MKGSKLTTTGFTLLETLITVSIVIILITIGGPSLNSFHQTIKFNTEYQRLRQTIYLARSYAITHKVPITLCSLDNNRECESSWQGDIYLFTDENRNQILDDTDLIVYTVSKPDHELFVRYYNRRWITFIQNGSAPGANGTFFFCSKEKYSLKNKHNSLVIYLTGRIREDQARANKKCSQSAA